MVNRMHVAVPQARDGVSRPPVIPAGVAQARAARDAGYKPPTEKDLQVHSHSPWDLESLAWIASCSNQLHFHWGMQLDVKCSDVSCALCTVMYILALLLMSVGGCSCHTSGVLCCIAVGVSSGADGLGKLNALSLQHVVEWKHATHIARLLQTLWTVG